MSSLKKNFGYQIAYRILTVITPLITSPIISRALGADNLGIYSATQAFANYFMFAAMLGIEKYGQRTIASAPSTEERQKYFWEIYAVQAISSTTSIIAYFIIVIHAGGSRISVMLIQGLWVFSCLLNIGWFYFGCEEFKVTVTRSLIVKLITVLLIVLLIRKPKDLALYSLIMAGGTAVSELVLWISLFKRIKFERPEWSRVKRHIGPIFTLFIPVIALSVYHIMDKTMLDVLSTEANVGWYYAVDKIIYIPLGLITAVSTVMMTRMSFVLHNEERSHAEALLEKSSELTMFLTCAVAFGIAAISKEFIPFFFGPGYEPCINLMYFFLPVLVIKALGDVVRTQFLIPSTRDKLYTTAVMCGAVTNVIFNAILIPDLGATGAVLGTLFAELIVFIVQIGGCRNEIRFVRSFTRHLYYMINGLAMLIIVRVVAEKVILPNMFLKLILMIIIGAMFYLGFSGLIWILKKETIFKPYINKILRVLGDKNG